MLYISEQQLYDNGLRYEDLVRAADVVVTKPGYGIISEAIANDAALLYTSRGHFVEYDVLGQGDAAVPARAVHRTGGFAERELERGAETLLQQPAPPEKPALNGAEVAAAEILKRVT